MYVILWYFLNQFPTKCIIIHLKQSQMFHKQFIYIHINSPFTVQLHMISYRLKEIIISNKLHLCLIIYSLCVVLCLLTVLCEIVQNDWPVAGTGGCLGRENADEIYRFITHLTILPYHLISSHRYDLASW